MERKQKKDFRLYLDTLQVIKDLSKEEAGEFLLSCIAYWEEENIEISRFSQLAFANTKAQFDRDFMSYSDVCDKNISNGKLGGRPTKTEITQVVIKKPKKPKWLQNNPNNPDTDTHTDTDNHTDNETIINNTIVL